MEGTEHFEHFEHTEHASHMGAFAKRAAVVVAFLAALLAIATISANRASTHTLLAQGQANDTYNEFEANSLKQHLNENSAASLRILAAGTAGEATARAQADKLETEVRRKYAPNKEELLKKARGLEVDRDHAESQHGTFQLSEGAFQIGIVLVSIALLTQATLLVFAGAGLGLLGLVALIIGYTVS